MNSLLQLEEKLAGLKASVFVSAILVIAVLRIGLNPIGPEWIQWALRHI